MIRLPTARRTREVADWLEAELLFSDLEFMSRTSLQGLLSDDLGFAEEWATTGLSEGESPLDEIEEADHALSRTIEDAFFLLDRRSARAGASYPFSQTEDGLARVRPWQDAVEYSFLTLLNARCLLGLGPTVSHHQPAILFERLVATALSRYISGEAARFGVPHSDFQGGFPARAKDLATRMCERPVPNLTTVTPQQGDYGLDVAAWKSFDDRDSKVVILCQCGIGDDFNEKTLPRERWSKVIDFVCAPLTALAIPFQDFGSEASVRSLAVDAGILLDRTRIARFADVDRDVGLRDDIVAWVDSAIPLFMEEAVS